VPANLASAVVVGTLPTTLSTSFIFSGVYPLLRIDDYKDGTIEQSLVTDASTYGSPANAPRMIRSWKLAKRLTHTQLATLRTFWFTTCSGGLQAFTFNDPITGASVTVHFQGNWEERTFIGRSVVPSLELVECA